MMRESLRGGYGIDPPVCLVKEADMHEKFASLPLCSLLFASLFRPKATQGTYVRHVRAQSGVRRRDDRSP